MNLFAEYVRHGWKLCRIQPGEKRPRQRGWNKIENAITDVQRALRLESAGLQHAWSGTCALDIDQWDKAEAWLKEKGINLPKLFAAPGAVQISSGRDNRGKLLYALPDPLPTIKLADNAFELRCAHQTGNSAQDVLPPSLHPTTKKPYEWVGDWRKLPPLPEELRTLWLSELPETENASKPDVRIESSETVDDVRQILTDLDPDCGYDEWIRVGMALHHELEGASTGLALWDEWSADSDKYKGTADLEQHWRSFGHTGHPVTLASLRKQVSVSPDDFDVVPESAETPEKPKRDFRFWPLPELFSRPEPDWIIPGVLPQATLGVIWGQPGVGKTFLAVDLAVSVATGDAWRGVTPERPGQVLYVAAEDDAGVQARFRSALAARGASDAPVRVLPASPNLTSADQAKALLEAIRDAGPAALVLFDTLSAVTAGMDENTSKDMGRVVAYFQLVSRISGGMSLLLHHEGKNSKGLRGSTVLPGAMDMGWEVTMEEGRRRLRIAKLKNAPDQMVYRFKLDGSETSCVVRWV